MSLNSFCLFSRIADILSNQKGKAWEMSMIMEVWMMNRGDCWQLFCAAIPAYVRHRFVMVNGLNIGAACLFLLFVEVSAGKVGRGVHFFPYRCIIIAYRIEWRTYGWLAAEIKIKITMTIYHMFTAMLEIHTFNNFGRIDNKPWSRVVQITDKLSGKNGVVTFEEQSLKRTTVRCHFCLFKNNEVSSSPVAW